MTIYSAGMHDPDRAARVRVAGWLGELAALTGTGADGDPAQPVLTLEFDGIVTLSRVAPDAGVALLTVSALLPPRAGGAVPAPALVENVVGPASALLWDSAARRQVIVRWLPAADLADERALLDAILATSDLARAWSTGAGAAPRPD